MHCYRCGRKLPDRVNACENCGQVFHYGEGAGEADVGGDVRASRGGEQLALPPSDDALVPSVPSVIADETDLELGGDTTPGEDLDFDDDGVSPPPALEDIPQRDVTAVSARIGDTAVSVQLPDLPDEPEEVSVDPALGLEVGQILSKRLELLAAIGRGPVGSVFKARDKKKGTIIAVKAIPPHHLQRPRDRARFEAAIGSVKALSHPNLCRIYGAGREGDTCFYLMPYLEGLTLKRLLDVKREEKRPFAFEEAEPIIVQLCQAIHFAHRATIHGGLKPENIFVQVDSLKIMDLGVSRAFGPKQFWRMQADAGKETYLAPEYSWEEPRVDRRADVYSLGVILYEMLTLRLPEVGIDSASDFNADLPRAVDRILEKALAKDPEARYRDADALKEEVLRVLGGDILADDLDDEPSEPSLASVSIGSADIEIGSDSGYPPSESGVVIEEDTSAEASPPPPPETGVATAQARPDADSGSVESAEEDASGESTPVGHVKPVEPLWVPDDVPSATEAAGTTRVEGESSTPAEAEPIRPAAARPDASSGAIPEPVGSNEASEEPGVGTPSWLERHASVPLAEVAQEEDPASAASPIPLEDEASPAYDAPAPDDRTTGRTANPPPEVTGATVAEEDRRTRPTDRPTRAIPERAESPASAPPPRGDRPTQAVPSTQPTALEERPTIDLGGATPMEAERLEVERPDVSRRSSRVSAPSALRPDPPFATGPSAPVRRPPRPPGIVTGDEPFRLRRSRTGSRFVLLVSILVITSIGVGFAVQYNKETLRGAWDQAMASWSGRTSPLIPPGAVCPKDMVSVPGGEFVVGSDRMDKDRDITEPVAQKISVAAYCIDTNEFPNRVGVLPHIARNWSEAVEACRSRGKRLCREIEWERACKGPSSTRYPFGNQFQNNVCNLGADRAHQLAKIGESPGCESGFGVADMTGNAWEWVADDFQPAEEPDEKVIKGGSSRTPAWAGRCAYRRAQVLDEATDEIGFRCCLDAATPG